VAFGASNLIRGATVLLYYKIKIIQKYCCDVHTDKNSFVEDEKSVFSIQ
jgi:hypothetical protein